jgi:hypothetical protein
MKGMALLKPITKWITMFQDDRRPISDVGENVDNMTTSTRL